MDTQLATTLMDVEKEKERELLKLDGDEYARSDPYLKHFCGKMREMYWYFKQMLQRVLDISSLKEFSEYSDWGFTVTDKEIKYHEWASGPIEELCIVGDFNGWKHGEWKAERDVWGHWRATIPHIEKDGKLIPRIPHKSLIKISLKNAGGVFTRLPQRTTSTVQFKGNSYMDAMFWNPPESEKYIIKEKRPAHPETLRIYECHVGMATEDGHIGSYREFADSLIPEIARKGYNVIQIMAVQEHSYYASFGYQPTSMFSIASRSGTPEDFKYLVDKAHEVGILVVIDFILGHCSANTADGLADWDGTSFMFMEALHPLWDCKVFNFSVLEATRYLLQCSRYFLREYNIDGYRVDAVTSMLYEHRGQAAFSGDYNEYFGDKSNMSFSGVAFLRLFNMVVRYELPDCITIAEDVSGFPSLCLPLTSGGVGFSYRLGMAIPDKWTKLMEDSQFGVKDEDWDLPNIVWTMINRRRDEHVIAYSECHDQALVGSKTLSFWLMDSLMYTHMTILSEYTPRMVRGISLHKIFRFITMGLGGDGYLCFMGNEFGHPEWIDFPTLRNNWSSHYCRRQWHLEKDGLLRYQHLAAFDRQLMNAEATYKWNKFTEYVTHQSNQDKIISWTRGPCVFVVNMSSTNSHTGFSIGVPKEGRYCVVLDSDTLGCGGFDRIVDTACYEAKKGPHDGLSHYIQLYLPTFVCLVLVEESDLVV